MENVVNILNSSKERSIVWITMPTKCIRTLYLNVRACGTLIARSIYPFLDSGFNVICLVNRFMTKQYPFWPSLGCNPICLSVCHHSSISCSRWDEKCSKHNIDTDLLHPEVFHSFKMASETLYLLNRPNSKWCNNQFPIKFSLRTLKMGFLKLRNTNTGYRWQDFSFFTRCLCFSLCVACKSSAISP